jgi:uncharacterized RDD family membrane protein YckC
MQKPTRPVSIEAEKKRNVRIAVGLAATGVALLIAIYVGMFVVMFTNPFVFLDFMPIPSEHKDMVSVDGRLVLFAKKIDFEGASLEKEPAVRTFMSEFDGEEFSNPVEVEPFSSASTYDGKLYFFSEDLYRVYDFNDWQVFENAAIGNSPRGAASPEGVWVLSNLMDRPALVLLKEGLALDVPLPLAEADEEDLWLGSSQLLWSEGRLHLFWQIGGSLLHEEYDGATWQLAGYFEDPGEFDVLEYRGRLMLFTHVKGQEFKVWTRQNGEWVSRGLRGVGKNDLSLGFEAAEFEGKVALLVNNLFPSEKLYLIEDAEVVQTFTSRSPFIKMMTYWTVFINGGFFLVAALLVFVISLILNRIKLTYWQLKRGRVRFASLFRRYLAYTIDTFVTTLPFGFFGYSIANNGFPPENPARFVGMIFSLVVGLVMVKFLYFSLFEGLWGKTPGKWICGIMVLRDNFTRCTVGRAFLRNLLRIADAMFYYFVALVSIGATLKWQRVGDLAAGTVVVRFRRKRKA